MRAIRRAFLTSLRHHVAHRHALGAGGEGQRHAVLQHRLGQRLDVVDRRRQAAVVERAGAGAERQRLAGARAGTPGDMLVGLGVALAGAGGADQLQDRLDDAFRAPACGASACWISFSRSGVSTFSALRFVDAGGLQQDAALGLEFGIEDVDLHQEAVELRLGQRIGAFLLERVLGGEHVERRRQVVAGAGDGDVVFLHRLQQRRLRARAWRG